MSELYDRLWASACDQLRALLVLLAIGRAADAQGVAAMSLVDLECALSDEWGAPARPAGTPDRAKSPDSLLLGYGKSQYGLTPRPLLRSDWRVWLARELSCQRRVERLTAEEVTRSQALTAECAARAPSQRAHR